MKRTISILVLIAMMLASVLAIIPAAAEEAAAPERKNVVFSDADAANYQFDGKGNVFYFDYHYYVAANGETWPITDKGPSLRRGQNSGSGSASATDGVKFSGGMNHQYGKGCATMDLADGTSVTHDHIFGYSFKESVTVDGFKIWVSSGLDNRDDISRVTIYGAVVDPAKIEAVKASTEEKKYVSNTYCYADPVLLYEMAPGDDLQYNVETDGDKKAAVTSGDFPVMTVDYILVGVDTVESATQNKYAVYELELYEAALVKDPATAADGDVLYTFNFKGDDVFSPAELDASKGNMEYIVSNDGKSVTIKGKAGGTDKTVNMWGGEVAGLPAALTDIYTLRYKVKAEGTPASADDAKNNSIGVGGWATDLTAAQPQFYNNYGNHNTAFGDDVSMRRTAISHGDTKYNGNYVKWATLPAAFAEDLDGFVDMLLVFDGPAGKISSYVLDANGAWMLIEEQAELKAAGNMGFFVYSYYLAVNSTVKDAKIIKGDFTTYVPPAVEEATQEELDGLKFYIDQAEVFNEEDFTDTSWGRLARALDRAKEIYSADVKPKTEVASRTTALMNAINSLVADMTKLNTLISECRKLVKTDYTNDTWATFDAALTAAKANESEDYATVKALYDALVAAKEALAFAPADKTELADLLARAALLKEEDFAAEDWATFAERVAEAKAVYDATDVTASAVADAAKTLGRAIKAINGGVIPEFPEENPTEEPTEEPTEQPTEKPTEQPTEKPTEQATATEPANEGGCGGIIGASA
ncbi:MAG: FIVAR domain-containing protein, partial [Clostridia bacterium]|nr:FIVAR domain-containing protein [Clostridia bacterium]